MSEYTITVNEQYQFELQAEQAKQLDLVSLDGEHFHVLKGEQTYQARLVDADWNTKTLHIKVNGTIYTVDVKDSFDQLVNELGLSAAASQRVDEVKAPMPGLVLSVEVSLGQTIAEGEALLILEAMKMENVIKAPSEVVIAEINIEAGQAVEKNQVLIRFE